MSDEGREIIVRKHLVALLAVLMLLMAAIPMQALAAAGITTIYTNSTQTIQKGDTGKVSLKIVAGHASERVAYEIWNEDEERVSGPTKSEWFDTEIGLGRAHTIYVDTSSLAVGDYVVKYWIEYKTSAGELDNEEAYYFSFEVLKNVCSGSHTMKQTSINKKPTCEVPGIALYTCSKCGLTSYEEIPMGHVYGDGVCTKKPTLTEAGKMTYTCTECGAKKHEVISVEEAIKIITQPKKASAYDGEKATVSVKASGKDLKYVWQYSTDGGSTWETTSASTGRKASYSLTMNAARNGRLVRCQITNKYKSVEYTDPVKLTTKFKAKITTQPKNAVAYKDTKATVTVTATGDGLKYQWYYKNPGSDSFKKSSIITADCSVTMTKARDGRQMYCVVTDKYGNTAKSKTVTLSIREDVKITTQPKNASAYTNKAVKFAVKASGDGLKYQWQYSDDGSTWKNASSTSSSYSPKMTKDRDGRQVRCVIKDAYGNKVTTKTVTMTLAAPKITTQPKNQTKAVGEKAKLTVKATGDGLKYQWQDKNAGSSTWENASSKKETYSPTVKASHDGRQFRCVVTDMYGKKVTSKAVKLTLK